MIIRFENLDNPEYSAQFTFDNKGFKCAEYDYTGFLDFTDVDPSLFSGDYYKFLDKFQYDVFTNDFVNAFLYNDFWGRRFWHSYKVRYIDGDYEFEEGFDSWSYSTIECSCYGLNDPQIDGVYCPDNIYSDFISDSYTSSKCMKETFYYHSDDRLRIAYYNFFSNSEYCAFYDLKYSHPTISFVEPDINYPQFKIFAYDFDDFSDDDCKYSLFLHLITLDSNDDIVDIKTVKYGSFGVYQGVFYFENFYGNKVSSFEKAYFDFISFFNTNTLNNVSDFMKDNYNNFQNVNINSFGKTFVFELKLEDYSGVYMSTLDCECLTTAINSLNTHIDILSKSFSEAFNKVPISDDYSYGSGSVFKSNDLDNIDFYDKFEALLSNECGDGLGLQFRKAFLSGNDCSKSVFRTFLNIDYADSFSSAFNLLSGSGSVFTNNALNPVNYRSIYDDFHDSFHNEDCGSWFLESFNEAFNLTNCQGSVFKANDDLWNNEDTLVGILYKQLDKSYVLDNSYNDSAFWAAYRPSDGVLRFESIPRILAGALFKNNQSRSFIDSVFMWKGNFPFTDILKFALFTGSELDYPTSVKSVFGWGSSDSSKILNHSCDVNPNSIRFCESVSQPAIPVEISSPIEISQPEDEWGEPVPFKMDLKPLLDLLSEALFCQFGNEDLDPRSSWGYSVFNKLLYPNNSEGCDDKVGLPELDFSEGFVPDNIFVNSNGLIARFNSEIYK